MFWKDFTYMWNDEENDKIFVFLGGFSAIGSLIGLLIHFLIYLKATKNIRKNK
jgi:prolipoprotein diacylglyceryltransferase